MKVHIVHKIYSNGVSVIQEVFSSKKKASAHLERWFEVDKKDGWEVSGEVVYGMGFVWKVMKNNDERNATRYRIESVKVS